MVFLDPGETLIETERSVGQFFVIQTKQVKNRRLQVVNVHRAIGDVKAKFISGAEGDTALHTAAGHPKTERLRMMIATLQSI